MARIAVQGSLPSLAARPRALRRLSVLASLVFEAASCTFDVTPSVRPGEPRERDTTELVWSQTSARSSDSAGQLVGAGQRSEPGKDASDTKSTDAGVPDAGQPSPSRPTSAAGSGATSAAGSSGAAGSGNAAGSASTTSGAPAPALNTMCIPGAYSGTFDGSVTFLQGSVSGIRGTLRAAMTLDPSGDYLRVSDGHVTGTNDLGATMNAGWTGALNCKTAELENAELQDGAWDNGTTFSGKLTGTYNRTTMSLSGTWQVASGEFLWAGGDGDWTMQRSATP